MTALYLRVSREDGDKKESQSISSQKSQLAEFARENRLPETRLYIDDGYSGLSFERPAFARMIEDIKSGVVDTVVTKDLSRLGRDYIMTGYYVENFFVRLGVRYISVNDGIDTRAAEDELLPFRAVLNDLYAKDISKKVRSALAAKKLEGSFIGSRPPYGYRRAEGDKSRLEPVFEEAGAVRLLFNLYLSGESLESTARALTGRGIPAPAGGAWNGATVRRILTNPTYAGHLTQNRTRKLSYKLPSRELLPRERWITVRDTHPAIISEEEQKKAISRIRQRGGRDL